MIRPRRSATVLAAVLVSGILLFAGSPRAQNTPDPSPRFDEIVRADFFAGFRGDAARLEKGMKRCEEELATNPTNADALVWHGAGLMFMAGQAGQRQDFVTATERARRGRAEMDRADQIAPDSLSVMLVRAVTLSASATSVRDRAQGRVMQESAIAGFERALEIQTPTLDRLSEHSRGELLAGLAEGWARLGDTERSRGYLERIVKEMPDTRYQARARAWLEDGPQAGPMTCLTCHRQ